MSQNQFNSAYAFTAKWEGGFSNVSFDPGGATIYGVASAYWPDDYKAIKALYDSGKKDEAKAAAKEFYRVKFWQECRCDDLPFPLSMVVFDTAVNLGSGSAIRMLQAVLGVPVDGVIGAKTTAVAISTDPRKTIHSFLSERCIYYVTRILEKPEKNKFTRGWMRRVIDLAMTATQDGTI